MGKQTRPGNASSPDTGARRRRDGPAASVAPARRGQRPSRWWTGAGIVVVVGFVVVLAVWVTQHNTGRPTATSSNAIPASPITSAVGRTSQPPWSAPSDVPAAVGQAGLPLLGAEGAVEHIHAHLDLIVNGQPVTVPADIGIDQDGGRISPLHTHDTSGVIHVESPTRAQFSLAQFFAEWQVALTATHLGGLRAGDGSGQLHAFVNGRPVAGNPGAITLAGHDEIALVYGPVPPRIPSTYNWGEL